ncbi:MAG: helix-turn-helix transcriptional regulator [Firmicutes bacterium]|nr:helix-turn-helix transcriptional regulator [Bacillota bacterium]
MSIVMIGTVAMMSIKNSVDSIKKHYIGAASILLCLWDVQQQTVEYSLITGKYISEWEYGIADTTGPTIFLTGLFTFIYIFKADFSPIFYADSKKPSSIEEVAEEHGLTVRELDVLKLVYEGKNNPEIAEELFISRNTVKKHLQNIYEKFDVKSRAELNYVINLKKEKR